MNKKAQPAKTKRKNGADPATAYDLIMDAIVTQKLAPSQKVSENILTEMFDISRTTARNIMEQLTAQQFLVSVSPRITRVAPLTLLDVKQNFAMRKMLQPDIFAMAASQVDYNQFVKLNEAISHKEPINDDAMALKLLKANKRFNLYMAQQVRYPLLIHWIRQLEDTTMRIYWLYVKIKHVLPYALEHQRALLEAVKKDQSAEIRDQTHKILSVCEERVLDAIFMHDRLYTQDLRLPSAAEARAAH
ncbi:GntR family transcriptional regulator [Amphiplicatus metriothermophilus]|uniref:Transcriptional regulator, GntR family n=1 Tax=Amphiplicatus metriothermophilus TaxID=1519374 RepID=A0A239PXV1_9PROT|nr:GntR family transcriptional regulator [Amphiplicatus metriothermophilus]MBB5518927.1 DNA-binding GntR family transcriptional regulator [Amphiplicatus metriothermophilus]SNT74487.1 transcriptional regulator, GntR family [Amphiplicatus metriothermophilus]